MMEPFGLTGIGIVAAVVIGMLIVHFVQKAKNGSKPTVQRVGRVIDKRSTPVSEALHAFFLTLEFDNRERVEVKVKEWEYGLIIVGDRVNYITQGSWKSIERMQ